MRNFSAHVVTVRDPFHPMRNREVRRLDCAGPIRALAPETAQPFIILRNGEAVLRADWDQPVEAGDLLAVVLLPQGGGKGSNPLKIILSVAMSLYAPYLATELIGIEGAAILGSTGTSIATAAIGMAGSALVNALIPSPKPPSPNGAGSTNYASASPTYSLTAQGNMARIDGAIPEHFGRLLCYPDFAAAPYLEYAGNEQYLYQLLCIGTGEYDLEAIRVEDTDIDNFEEIEYEVVAPGQPVTLFPTAVATATEVAGQELAAPASATYSQSGTTITITRADHGYAAGRWLAIDFTSGTASDDLYEVASVIDDDTFTVTAASATTSGNASLREAIGPFAANGATTTANRIAVDLVTPRGLYYANDSGGLDTRKVQFRIEARAIDDDGDPLGDFFLLGEEEISAATTTPQRRSYSYAVPSGRYEVLVYRTNSKDTSSRAGNEVDWSGLRAYLNSADTFGDVTLVAMKLRATNNLSNQASRKINMIATRKLPIWDGSAWSAINHATRSPAWAIAYCAKRIGLPDSRIDLAGLLALDAVWAARGDTFDGRFDQVGTWWDSVSKIAQAGRAKPFMQGSILYVWRDQEVALPVAMYGMRNIVRGSFALEFVTPTPDTADAVEVSYFDDTAWKPRRVTAKLAGSTAAKPAKVDLFGCVDRAQAYREGLYMAANNRYRRTLIKFETEMEGFVPSYGDLIAISHDLPQWGQGGEIVSWDAGTKTAILSEPLTWKPAETHYIGLRRRDGSLSGPYTATIGISDYHVVLATDPDFTPYTGQDEERTHFTFGWGETWRQLARVIAIRPRGPFRVGIEAINEDPSVHTADTGAVAPPVVSSQLPSQFTAPRVTGLIARAMPDDINKMVVSWQPAAGADHYLVEQGPGDGTWTRMGEPSSSSFSGFAFYGAGTMIRVAAVGLTRGPWAEIGYATGAGYMWNTDDTTLMWNVDDTTLMWSA